MIKNVQVVPLQVHNLDNALEFYTQKVGLEVGADFTMDGGFRWLTVKVPGTDYPEILLMQAETDAKGSRAVLTAAALTYLAAAVTSILQLLYYISVANRRG